MLDLVCVHKEPGQVVIEEVLIAREEVVRGRGRIELRLFGGARDADVVFAVEVYALKLGGYDRQGKQRGYEEPQSELPERALSPQPDDVDEQERRDGEQREDPIVLARPDQATGSEPEDQPVLEVPRLQLYPVQNVEEDGNEEDDDEDDVHKRMDENDGSAQKDSSAEQRRAQRTVEQTQHDVH